ncbi:MAG: sn-glycerol-3-phosphate ABC transporter ATP-binding protein UgpC [Elioraea sp.]|nr:sn-glycerol-3-phosphate ABC transporter ATP-binding protein UgpC [Elioraea sp.]
MATLELRGIRKSFGAVPVLHGIDLQVAEGEFIVIVGASGCGKSTLLRIVAGLEAATEGSVLIGGADVTRLEPKDRDIAMVFQNYALYPHMSVFDNMAYGLRIRGLPRAEIEERVRRTAEMLGLAELLRRKPRELSGGQRQRVAMGRAIVREPKLFLFDEPLSNLDAKLRVQMRAEIKRLQRRLGVTSLYVTHDQVEAMTLGDRLVVMNEGRAEQIATPMEVWREPANTYVAGFIGAPAMNFLHGRLCENGHAVDLRAGPAIALAAPPASATEAEVTVGIRPEHVRVVGNGAAGALPLRVDLVEPLGAESLIHGILPSGEGLTVRASDCSPLAGTTLPIVLPAEHLHLFGGDGRRLRLAHARGAAAPVRVGV